MEIGTLIIKTHGKLIENVSAEAFISQFGTFLKSITEKYDVDWRRFEYLSASTIFVIPIDALWRNDSIYKTLKKILDKHFNNWEFEITVLIHEIGV